MKKKVAIIGAGPAGLVAAKSCLESGLHPVVFEKSFALGGIWSGGDQGVAWDGMHTNVSKWTCMFSDFPWDKNVQDFPQQSEVADYLKKYADHFNVTKNIRFDSEVENIRKSGDSWNVIINGYTETFDAVMIASGFFAKPVQPAIEGTDIFNGDLIHSSQCHRSDIANKNKIIIYGGSFSGYELAMEFARVCKTPITHAFKRASWVMSRNVEMEDGTSLPLDLLSYSRPPISAAITMSEKEEREQTIAFLKAAFGNPGDAHADLTVSEDSSKPTFVIVSDGYLKAVRDRKIIPVHGNIHHLTQNHLVLNQPDGQQKSVASDLVVMATGYRATLPYLDDTLQFKIDYHEQDQFMPVLLHDTVWPKDVDGLAFVGFYRGPYFGVMELQARWAAGVFAGHLPAPSSADIQQGIKAAENIRNQMPQPQFPHADYEILADRLAKKIGCYPDVNRSDPLYDQIHGGFFLPSHYRLSGQHSNRALVEQVIAEMPYPK